MKAKFTVKYISRSGLSCLLQAAKDSNKKVTLCFNVTITQNVLI